MNEQPLTRDGRGFLITPIDELVTALRARRLSPDDEIANASALARVVWAFEQVFERCSSVVIHPVGTRLVVNGRSLTCTDETADNIRTFAVECEQRGIGAAIFTRVPTPEGINALLGGWDTCASVADPRLALATRLERGGIQGLRLLPGGPQEASSGALLAPEEFVRQTYFKAIDTVAELFDEAAIGRPLALSSARRVVQRLVDVMINGDDGDRDHLLLLTEVKRRHGYLPNHAVNTCVLALGLGHAMSVDRSTLRSLGTAALLADIGAAALPDPATEAQAGLSDDQWRVLEEHPPMGVAALCRGQETDATLAHAMLACLSHHKSWDGGGYPERLDIERSLLDDVISVADRFDGLRSGGLPGRHGLRRGRPGRRHPGTSGRRARLDHPPPGQSR